jgi:hypothetical protein
VPPFVALRDRFPVKLSGTFQRSIVKNKLMPANTAIRVTLLYLSQKSVDSFEKKCIMARVEDGLIAKHQHPSHPRPEHR